MLLNAVGIRLSANQELSLNKVITNQKMAAHKTVLHSSHKYAAFAAYC